MIRTQTASETRAKLLDAARDVIRTKGYAGSTVDDICAAAGVTKGSFFYYFDSKEELGVAAIERFGAMAATLFGNAPYRSATDPRNVRWAMSIFASLSCRARSRSTPV